MECDLEVDDREINRSVMQSFNLDLDMLHPLTSEIPLVQDLIQNHEVYMSHFAKSEREKCLAFTTRLNMLALKDIASSALGSEGCSIDKIYQGMMEQTP